MAEQTLFTIYYPDQKYEEKQMVPSLVNLMVGLARQSAIHTLNLLLKVSNHSMSDITVQFHFFNFGQLYDRFLFRQGSFPLNVNS